MLFRSRVFSPLLHAVWKPDPKGRDQVRMSLTRSYRAPSTGTLIARPTLSTRFPVDVTNDPTSPDRAGNPDLKPELATGIDLAFERYLSGGGLLSNPVGTGTGTAQAGFVGNCSIKGKIYPLVPQHQASFSAEYRSDPFTAYGQNWQLVGQGDISYESSKFVQVHNLAETGSTTLVGARLGLEGERWALSAYGQNLTDEDTITLATRWFTTPYGFGATPSSTAPSPR